MQTAGRRLGIVKPAGTQGCPGADFRLGGRIVLYYPISWEPVRIVPTHRYEFRASVPQAFATMATTVRLPLAHLSKYACACAAVLRITNVFDDEKNVLTKRRSG